MMGRVGRLAAGVLVLAAFASIFVGPGHAVTVAGTGLRDDARFLTRVPRPHAAPEDAVWDTLASLEIRESWAASESVAVRQVRRLEAMPSVDSLPLSRALLYVANGRLKQRLYAGGQSFDALERAIAIRERHLRSEDRLAVWAHITAATHFNANGLPSRGFPHAESALRALATASPPDSGLLTQAHNSLALCLGSLGRIDEAQAHYDTAVAVCEAVVGRDGLALAPVLAEQADFMAMKRSDYDQSRSILARAEEIAERARDYTKPLEMVLFRRSILEDRLGNVSESLDLAQRAYDLTRARTGERSVESLNMQKNIGNIFVEKVGDFRTGAAIYGAVAPGLDATQGPSSSIAVNTRLGLIDALVAIGDTTQAAQELERARAVLAQQPELANRNTVYLLQIVADLENARGRGSVARDSLRRAIAIEWKANGKTGGRRGILYEHWMRTIQGPGDREALDEAARDITRLTDSTTVRRLWVWQPLVAARSAAEARLGLRDLAWEHALESEAWARTRMVYQVLTLPDAYLLHVARRLGRPCDLLVALSRADHEDDLATSWGRLVHWRGLVRREIARRRLPVAAASDTALAGRHGRWIASQRKLAQLVVTGTAHPDDPKTASLFQAAKRAADQAEYRYHQASSATIPAEDSLTLDRVLSRLGPSQALVAFAIGSTRAGTETLGAFVATGTDRRPRWVALGASAEITALVGEWTRRMGTPPPSGRASQARDEALCRQWGEKVRDRVWGPIARAVGAARDLYLVPEGPATEIPWLAIPTQGGAYLADGSLAIHVIDSESDLLSAPDETSTGILALGAPDFDHGGSPSLAARSVAAATGRPTGLRSRPRICGGGRLSLSALPGARSEIETIGKTWPDSAGPAEVLIGADADEATFKHRASGHSVLHLATHGIVVSDTCSVATSGARGVGGLAEIVAAAPVRPKRRVPAAAPAEHESSDGMNRQVWLALAGANRSPSDATGSDEGLLTAEEIVTLDLRGTDWVVLSACHSGFATTWGREGVLGMRRAFRLAGARAVITSAWAIGDESTREWMAKLYEARARGRLAGPAVGDACRAVLTARRAERRSTHPFYWAAFSASGE